MVRAVIAAVGMVEPPGNERIDSVEQMRYILPMSFDWDADNIAHIARHDVLPHEAEEALGDPDRIADESYSKNGERRAIITGLTYDERLITVIITMRPGPRIRVVTARPASKQERQDYEDALA